MAQHDYNIANDGGAAFRADLNNALAAAASTNKGSSAPATPYAGLPWLDDNTPSSTRWAWSFYDGSDWIKVGELDVTDNLFRGQVGGGRVDIASSATCDLGSDFTAAIRVTGTTNITSFGSSAPKGAFKFVTFTGALTLTHNGTSLILPTGADIVTAAGDTLIAEPLGSGNWRVHNYTPASGVAVGGGLYKVGTTTRDVSTASGPQAVTGVGFKPKLVLLVATIDSASKASVGFSDASGQRAIHAQNAATWANAAAAVMIYTDGSNNATATVTSLDADGFTLTWVKNGSPTGTAGISYIAMR